jgi:hypothetical protein
MRITREDGYWIGQVRCRGRSVIVTSDSKQEVWGGIREWLLQQGGAA